MGGTFVVRMFFITAGYHATSRTLVTCGRAMQFVSRSAAAWPRRRPLWWAATTVATTDTPTPTAIPTAPRGFWWSHIGWILSDAYDETPLDDIADFAAYPELRWLNRHDWVPPWALAVVITIVAGWPGLLIGSSCRRCSVARDLHRELVVHVVGPAATPRTTRAGTTSPWRSSRSARMAQQPPLLPASARRALLVGVRRDVLGPQGALVDGPRPHLEDAEPRGAHVQSDQGRNLDLGMAREYLRQLSQVVDRSRVAALDVSDLELDTAKSRSRARSPHRSGRRQVVKLDRRRRRARRSALAATTADDAATPDPT